jgi:hypothetical protein
VSPWSTFWPEVAATAVGVAVGVPIGLWLARWARRHARKAERQRLNRALQVVTEALDENRELLNRLLSTLKAGDSLATVLPLLISAWETARPDITPNLDDAGLVAHLARHFERTGYLVALHGRYVELYVGPAVALEGVETLQEEFAKNVTILATRLLGEIEGLKERIRQRMTPAD